MEKEVKFAIIYSVLGIVIAWYGWKTEEAIYFLFAIIMALVSFYWSWKAWT